MAGLRPGRLIPLAAAVALCLAGPSDAFTHTAPPFRASHHPTTRLAAAPHARRPLALAGRGVQALRAGPDVQAPALASKKGGGGGVPTLAREGMVIIGLCCLCGTISSLDRMAMSVCIVPLSQEFGYTETVKGSISSIFSIGYTIALLPLAIAQAVASPKYIMALGVTTWSILTVLTPQAAVLGVPYLLAARAGVGAAEAVTVPTIQTFVSRWVPKSQRSRALSVLYSCLQSGTILALLVAPNLVKSDGYPAVFTSFGLLGFGWLALWLPIAKDTPDNVKDCAFEDCAADQIVGEEEVDLVIGSPNIRSPATTELPAKSGAAAVLANVKELPWGAFLQSKGLWAATVAHAANNWGLYVSLAWLPTFFTQQYGMDLGKSSYYSLLPYVAGATLSGVAGVSADKLMGGGMDSTQVRKIMQGIGSFGPLACMLALSSVSAGDNSSSETAAALFVAAVGLGAFSSAGFGTSLQDISGKYSGLLYGLTSIISSITGAAGVYYTGVILDSTHSWSNVFATTAGVYALGGLWYTLFYNAAPMFEKGSVHADE